MGLYIEADGRERSVTQKDKIKEYVKANPGKTAAMIATATELKAANVSSVLIKGYNAGAFKREKLEGTKGWVYFLV